MMQMRLPMSSEMGSSIGLRLIRIKRQISGGVTCGRRSMTRSRRSRLFLPLDGAFDDRVVVEVEAAEVYLDVPFACFALPVP